MSPFRGKRRYPTKIILPIDAWIKVLDDRPSLITEDVLKFNDAVDQLTSYGEAAVIPLIDSLLNTESRSLRIASIWAFRRIGDKRAVEPLLEMWQRDDIDRDLQHDIVIALGQLRDNRVFEVLAPLINHQTLRGAAISALGLLGDSRAVDLLLPLLNDPNEDIRFWTAVALGNLRDQRAAIPIVSALPKTKSERHFWIIEALGKIGGIDAINTLEAVLNADDILSPQQTIQDRLRCDVVRALAQIDDLKARQIIEKALTHRKRSVRRIARQVLTKS
jgi:HEAT repeat protein